MPLSEEEYVAKEGGICPWCESKDICGGAAEFDGDYCWLNVVCDACNKEWTDLYSLVGYEELVVP